MESTFIPESADFYFSPEHSGGILAVLLILNLYFSVSGYQCLVSGTDYDFGLHGRTFWAIGTNDWHFEPCWFRKWRPPIGFCRWQRLIEIPNPIGADSNYQGGRPDGGVSIPGNQLWSAILNGIYTEGKDKTRKVDIRMMVHAGETNMLASHEGQKKGIEAVRKLEFMVCNAMFLHTTAQYSDLVLPVTSQWECDGLLQDDGNREAIFLGSKAIEPLFESKDDLWIAREIGARLGLDTKLIESATLPQEIFNSASGAMVITVDGKGYEPLLTITEEDIQNLGAVGTPQTGRILFKELKEKGIW